MPRAKGGAGKQLERGDGKIDNLFENARRLYESGVSPEEAPKKPNHPQALR